MGSELLKWSVADGIESDASQAKTAGKATATATRALKAWECMVTELRGDRRWKPSLVNVLVLLRFRYSMSTRLPVVLIPEILSLVHQKRLLRSLPRLAAVTPGLVLMKKVGVFPKLITSEILCPANSERSSGSV